MRTELLRYQRNEGHGPEPGVQQHMACDAMHRTDDQRGDRGLHRGEHDSQCSAPIQPEAHVEPRDQEHQREARQHEAEPGENSADAAP